MKKRIMGLVGVSLIGAMLVTSLTGCGLQTKATDIVVNDGDTVIIDQEDMSTEIPETEKTESVETETTEPSEPTETSTPDDEITSSEVVGNETEEPGATENLEDDNIILYAEKGEKGLDIIPDELEYTPYDGVINAESRIGLYDGKGYRIGEMKIGGTVYVNEINTANNRARFKNPIEGTEYDYLYVSGNKVQSNNMTKLTAQVTEDLINELIGNFDMYTLTEKTDDMEVCEFMIPVYYDEMDTPSETIFFTIKDSCDEVWSHRTLAIECVEDTTEDYILCRIYYKD